MRRKEPAVAAEALALLLDQRSPLRARLIARGRERVKEFSRERTRDRLVEAVARALEL
jgi:glycosyltransferase involved in cell wall biosynthesis